MNKQKAKELNGVEEKYWKSHIICCEGCWKIGNEKGREDMKKEILEKIEKMDTSNYRDYDIGYDLREFVEDLKKEIENDN